MTLSVRRWLLLFLAAISVYVGAWALFAPASWWASFPGLGLHWLPVLGVYNEHLARDVGALYLALAALSAGAAARPHDDYLVRLTAAVWLVFSIPHLIYNVLHLDHYTGLDRAGNVVSLGFFVLAGVMLLFSVPRSQTPSAG